MLSNYTHRFSENTTIHTVNQFGDFEAFGITVVDQVETPFIHSVPVDTCLAKYDTTELLKPPHHYNNVRFKTPQIYVVVDHTIKGVQFF